MTAGCDRCHRGRGNQRCSLVGTGVLHDREGGAPTETCPKVHDKV